MLQDPWYRRNLACRKLKKQTWKESLSECNYIWLVFILRLEIWSGSFFPDGSSMLFNAVAVFSLSSRHRREGGSQIRDSPVGIKDYSNLPAPGKLCISLAWREYQSPAAHSASPPTGFCLFPRTAEHTLSGIYETSRHVHRAENLICCYGNLGYSAQ